MTVHRDGASSPGRRHSPAVPLSTVLVVDDEHPVREFLQRWLESWGYPVKTAADASEALAVMLADPVSIILCDIKMPGHDGLWLAEQVRARWPKTAVIMATGAFAYDLDMVVASRKLGVVDYVMKPFQSEMLRQALRRAADALEASTRQGAQPRS